MSQAENVKVICKKQHSDDAPERIQVRQTIQNARYRAAANVANVTFRGTGIPNGGAPSTQRMPVSVVRCHPSEVSGNSPCCPTLTH